MKIRDIYYNITAIYYSVHYKNKPTKKITIDFLYFSCANLIIIEKSYWKFGHKISIYYKIKRYKYHDK